jgi:hypothetical protein
MSEVVDWSRPHFDELVESDAVAEVFYVVVGPRPDQPLKLSRARHHLDRIEPELVINTVKREEDPAWFDAWFHAPVGRGIEGLFANAEELRNSREMTVVRGKFAERASLDYLRNTIGVVSAIADTPGTLAVFDALAVSWWRLSEWREAFVDRSGFRIADHVSIAVTDEEKYRPGFWTHTRGMAKFARPDLQMKHLPGDYATSNPAIRVSGKVLYGMASYLAQGARVRDGQTMYLPETDATVTFLLSDDTETRKHFGNAAIEVCDFDEKTGMAAEGVGRLLERAGRTGADRNSTDF